MEIADKQKITFNDEFIKIIQEMLEIFNLTSERNLLTYLKQFDKPTVCAKKMVSGNKLLPKNFL